MIPALLLVVVPGTASGQKLSGSIADLAFLNSQGQEIRLNHMLSDGPALLYFWATWCKGCRKTQPAVSALAKRYKGRLQVIGINVGGLDSAEAIEKYRSRHAISYPLLRDRDNAAVEAYHIYPIPAFMLLDGKGNVRYRGNVPPPNLEDLL
jgi:thiol-disulfide isomerase/thioredoxin